jgi:hypothetical protein
MLNPIPCNLTGSLVCFLVRKVIVSPTLPLVIIVDDEDFAAIQAAELKVFGLTRAPP